MVQARTKSEGEGSVVRHPLSYDGIGLLKTRELARGLAKWRFTEQHALGHCDGVVSDVSPQAALQEQQ